MQIIKTSAKQLYRILGLLEICCNLNYLTAIAFLGKKLNRAIAIEIGKIAIADNLSKFKNEANHFCLPNLNLKCKIKYHRF
jgi:tRNA A22 N-methylase